MIEVQSLSYQYDEDGAYALRDVSFHVKQGEWLSIVGHNGSGKSTLVRLIDGLLEASEGRILIKGEELTPENIWEKRSEIGMVFQNPDNQFVGATVEDDVAFGLENRGVSHQEMHARVAEALELVGMSEFATREPARLSGGQKQRVAIAGVLAMRPAILILDEATSMLDPEGRLELMRLVQEVRKSYQMTVVSITHDLDEVALSDRVLVMKAGQVESSCTPKELFERTDLVALGLDEPFSVQLIKALTRSGMDLGHQYYAEGTLEEIVWQSLSKK